MVKKTYNEIYNGKWLSHGEYAVIHRLAVDQQHKGLGILSEVMKIIEKMCVDRGINNIKIDTHEQNLPMQKFLKKMISHIVVLFF